MIAIVFDTETTGLPLPSVAPLEDQPRIIELGAVKVDGNAVLGELSQMIDPRCPLPKVITKITGITDEQLVGQPTFAEFLPQLKEFFAGADALICHNAPFDSVMLRNDLARAGCGDFPWPEETICSAQEYTPVYGGRLKLQTLYERILGKSLAQTHRALDDARALHELLAYDKFFDRLSRRGP